MKITDFKGLGNTYQLKVVKTWREDDKYIIEMESGNIEWRPGEHAIFSLPGRQIKGKKWRAFSIASTPSEGVVRIATKLREPISGFKQQLQKLKKGDHVKMRGPFGWFYRQDDSTPAVMIAGGIGITPILALLKEYQELPSQSEVHVLYSETGEHLFRKQLDEIAQSNSKISIEYLKDSKQVDESMQKLNKQYGTDIFYYISGAPIMIKSLTKKIKGLGVKKSKIITDPYIGY